MSENKLTLEAFADWIHDHRGQYQPYEWSCAHVCACGQYARHLGIQDWTARATPNSFWNAANHLANMEPRTFGALEWRLRHTEKVQ